VVAATVTARDNYHTHGRRGSTSYHYTISAEVDGVALHAEVSRDFWAAAVEGQTVPFTIASPTNYNAGDGARPNAVALGLGLLAATLLILAYSIQAKRTLPWHQRLLHERGRGPLTFEPTPPPIDLPRPRQ
jgi:hypothetical protein